MNGEDINLLASVTCPKDRYVLSFRDGISLDSMDITIFMNIQQDLLLGTARSESGKDCQQCTPYKTHH